MQRTQINSEKLLLEKLKKGDSSAFEALFNRYKERLYWFILRFAKNEEISLDIMHDVMLKLWEGRSKLDTNANFSAYLHTISKNHVFNFLKQAARRETILSDILHDIELHTNTLEQDYYFMEYKKIAYEAVDQLPPRRKQVFQSCKLDGMSYDETATSLGISRNAVKDHMVKASKFIKYYFHKHAQVSL